MKVDTIKLQMQLMAKTSFVLILCHGKAKVKWLLQQKVHKRLMIINKQYLNSQKFMMLEMFCFTEETNTKES